MATVKTTCQQHPDVRAILLFFFFSHGTKFADWVVACCPHTDLRKQFLEIARKNSPEPRTVYSFMTTAIVRAPFLFMSSYLSNLCAIIQDTRAMFATLAVIRTNIVFNYLQSAELLH